MQNFYVDTCIYLNLWKKERGVIFGKPFWIIAKKFFDYASNQEITIYYSGFILKELFYKLDKNEFIKKRDFIESPSNFIRTNLNKEEYKIAESIMKESRISFFDAIHLVLAKKTNSILITRDKELLKVAKRFKVIAKKPEEIIP